MGMSAMAQTMDKRSEYIDNQNDKKGIEKETANKQKKKIEEKKNRKMFLFQFYLYIVLITKRNSNKSSNIFVTAFQVVAKRSVY